MSALGITDEEYLFHQQLDAKDEVFLLTDTRVLVAKVEKDKKVSKKWTVRLQSKRYPSFSNTIFLLQVVFDLSILHNQRFLTDDILFFSLPVCLDITKLELTTKGLLIHFNHEPELAIVPCDNQTTGIVMHSKLSSAREAIRHKQQQH